MSEEHDLKIPFAYNGERFVRPSEAERDNTYFCPNCGEKLIYRKGDHTRPHFAHYGDTICSTPETILHHAAKRRLKHLVEEGLKMRSKSPFFVRKCRFCYKMEVEQRIPTSVQAVAMEKRLPNGYQPDVLLMSDEETKKPIAALEVFVTNAVGAQKEESIGLPWMEVQGRDVMRTLGEEAPVRIEVDRDSLEVALCKKCKREILRMRRRIRNLLNRWGMEWPGTPYQVGLTDCWKCEATIPVFRWGNDKFSTEDPPDPKPWTVQFRHSKTAMSKYWANTCPVCKATQGDWFLRKVDGPFGVSCDSDTRLLKRAQKMDLLP